MMNGFEQALTSGVEGGTIILFPALGELIGERAGIVNLGTEGCMLSGALAAYAVGATTGSAWLGVIAGFFAGSVVGFAHGWLVVKQQRRPAGERSRPLVLGHRRHLGDRYRLRQRLRHGPAHLEGPRARLGPLARADPVPPRPFGLRQLFPCRHRVVGPLPDPCRPGAAGHRRAPRGCLGRRAAAPTGADRRRDARGRRWPASAVPSSRWATSTTGSTI